jgi:hypothetical protein
LAVGLVPDDKGDKLNEDLSGNKFILIDPDTFFAKVEIVTLESFSSWFLFLQRCNSLLAPILDVTITKYPHMQSSLSITSARYFPKIK